jgi:hypothetical protein
MEQKLTLGSGNYRFRIPLKMQQNGLLAYWFWVKAVFLSSVLLYFFREK